MNTSHEERQLCWRPVLRVLLGWLASGGCLPKSIPLASLPMEQPMATDLNLTGIDQYQAGQWMEAFGSFDAALQVDPDFVEAHFNAGLALHQMDRHEEATRHFRRAGELDPRNATIVNSVLYRNHLGLSSTLERHLSGGYRYQH
ncbi:MAG: tetratricopeptide repeat protein [Nitrospirales bacterium]|nr:tetratricopeptide repeat protein [Nitrospirales bacterium]